MLLRVRHRFIDYASGNFSGAIFAASTKTRDWSRAPPAYIACNSTQAIMAMPITDTNQASVRSQGMPNR